MKIEFRFKRGKGWDVVVDDGKETSTLHRTSRTRAFESMKRIILLAKPSDHFRIIVEDIDTEKELARAYEDYAEEIR